ncbi:MAG: urea amidolyase family protein, partial [Micrococcales bacterium]|nr:urea amidolyase family protein [Micrococcales bacterium]
ARAVRRVAAVAPGAATPSVAPGSGVPAAELNAGSSSDAVRPGRRGEDCAAAFQAPRRVEIPVVYDGEDLAEVAALTGLAPDEVAARHAAGRYRVAFGGFMPGFAYLTGLDPVLVVPRRATPRTRVPAGAVAVAGQYAAVYPRATPGGWRLLGRTETVMFDLARDEHPALLMPGDEVRFVPVPHEVRLATRDEVRLASASDEVRAIPVPGETLAAPPPAAGVEVLATGPLVLVEDVGRPGLAAIGVPRSGVADPAALRAANRLVGNRANAAVLEVMLGGLVVRFGATTAIALVGAPAAATLDGVSVPCGQAVRAAAASTLELGIPAVGLRTWLAVRGGVDVPSVLGSRSADVLSGIGPVPVAAGDVLPLGHAWDGLPELGDPAWLAGPGSLRPAAGVGTGVGAPSAEVPGAEVPGPDVPGADVPGRDVPGLDVPGAGASGAVVVGLAATPGPRAEWLTQESRARLGAQEWVVSSDSNRVALRLDGPPLCLARDDELPSEPLVHGAVQVPRGGRPVVFGPDHPVTGGYPVVAVLTAAGIAAAAQCRPGDRVRFVVREGEDHLEIGT